MVHRSVLVLGLSDRGERECLEPVFSLEDAIAVCKYLYHDSKSCTREKEERGSKTSTDSTMGYIYRKARGYLSIEIKYGSPMRPRQATVGL